MKPMRRILLLLMGLFLTQFSMAQTAPTDSLDDMTYWDPLMDAIIDKFGKDVTVFAHDMHSFRVVVNTSVGSVFYSWVFGFRGRVSIKSPEEVKNEYAQMVSDASKALE